MEERQTQIKEGAGLEESKLNVEFIDWLQKWSTPILMVIAVAAVGFMLYRKWEKAKLDKVDRAFGEYTAAAEVGTPNPVALAGIADQYEGIRGVSIMARMKAADEYLESVRKGLKTGARVEANGTAPAEDVLTDEDRTRYLADAKRLYQAVLDKASAKPALAVHAISAAYGLAAVAECNGDTAGAQQAYDQVTKLAESSGFPDQAAAAKKRSENLASLGTLPKLYEASSLPKPPEPPKPPGSGIELIPGPSAPTGATGATAEPGATGSTAGTGDVPKPETPPVAPTGATGPATPAPAPTAPTGTPAPTSEPTAPPPRPSER